MDDLKDLPEICRKEGGNLDDPGDNSLSWYVVSMDDLGDMPEFCKKKEVTWRTLGTSHFLGK